VLREISVGHAGLDRALRDAAYAIADEAIALARDVDRLDVDLRLSGPRGAAVASPTDTVDAGISLRFTGDTSWTAGNIGRAAARPPAAAPEAFFRLPGDSVAAGYSRYADPERVRPVAAGVATLAEAYLDFLGVPAARRTAIARALEATLTSGSGAVYATLNVPPGQVSETAPESERMREVARAALGIHLVGMEGKEAGLFDLASELVKLFSDRALRAQAAKALSVPESYLPMARQFAVRARGIPAGTQAFELSVPAEVFDEPDLGLAGLAGKAAPARKSPVVSGKGKAARKAPPLVVALVLAPDGPVTWLGLGTDVKALTARVAAVRAPDEGQRLSARAGLERLRTEPALAGGFATLAASLAGLPASEAFAAPLLERLPSRGQTPMTWKMRAESAGPRLEMATSIPRAAVEDIIAWVSSIADGYRDRARR